MMSAIASVPVPARRLVLVADDEAAIYGLVARVMRQLGFGVLPVGDGAAVIAVVEANRGDLACALLDIIMPIMLMSGALPAYYADRIERLRLAGMLHKPFPLAALRELIRHAVGDGVASEPE
jgi:CheY-like chemotaxis protein